MKKIIEDFNKHKLNSNEAMGYIKTSYDNHISVIEEKLDRYKEQKRVLESNLDLYKSKGDKINYDKTFSNWNSTFLMISDFEDLLYRLGHIED